MVTVSFGGPLEFGVAGLGDSVPRDAQNDGVPADAIVTASIAPASTLFSIASVTAYNVAVADVPPGELPPGHVGPPPKQRVYTETRHSDGKAPLFVLKGQAVGVRVALTVPTSAVMPGDVAATLTIQGDTWDQAAAVALRGSLLAVDESTPIGEKWRELGALAFSGAVLANAQTMSDGLGAFQTFSNGAIVYSPDFGAVWLAQPVFAKLNAPEVAQGRSASGDNIRDYLGYPTDDTFPTIEPGGHATIFTRGVIVVRSSGAAFVVYGPIYGHYAHLGNIAAGSIRTPVVGLPISDEEAVPNGRRSRFDGGDIYWKSSTGAWEMHGAIRARWDALGGPNSFLGYPKTDEVGVMNGATEIGRSNTFEHATIFWSGATGAFECHGGILEKYLASGGPASALGFPTTNETDTPGGGRYNAFQNGLVVWHSGGPYQGAFTVGNSLQVQLFSYQDSSHDDFNVQVHLDDSRGQQVRTRMPASDEYGNGNVQFNPPVVLLAASGLASDYTIDVWMLCIRERTFGSDDEDGTVTAHFDIDNLWGTADSPLYANGAFHVDMKPVPQPQIFTRDPARFRTNLFWPFHNWSTDAMTWTQFSQTFTNVGEGDLGFNVLPWNWHLWERAFFQLVYRSIAAGGNCFGMCLESIYARESRAPFVEPIYDSPDNTYSHDARDYTPGPGVNPNPANANDTAVIDRVNVKMGYQVGADFINWFIAMEVENDTQDAVLAFKSSRDAYAGGNWPMIMLSPSSLSQDGHVVVPYQWLVSFGGAPPIEASDQAINSQPLSSQAWIVRVANPNATPNSKPNNDVDCEIRISPLANTWTFTGAGGNWSGSKGSDGRIFCAPYSLLNYEPTMVGDFILGLLQGLMVVVFSGDGETHQITDHAGRTYFAPAVRGSLPTGALAARLPREINRDPRSRIPDMGFVPTYHDTADPPEAVPPYEIYCIRRPPPAMGWSQLPSRDVAPLPTTASLERDARPSVRNGAPENELTYRIAAAGSPYRWNLSAPRMSVDVVCATAADALDEVRLSGGGSASQTVTLRTDAQVAARQFQLTVAGWRGHDRQAKKAFIFSKLSLEPGAALSAALSDGGKEVGLHNAGPTLTCALDVFTAHRGTPLVSTQNLKLDAGTTVRLRPSDWALVDGNATLLIETIGSQISIAPQISNTLANLNGVAFPDTSHGWAEGAIEKGDGTRVGIIVATSDGGATWTKVFETTMQLRDIAFPDVLHGWAVGGDPPAILATVDGGGTWKLQTSGIEDEHGALFTASAFPDTQNGWIVGAVSNGGVIVATDDGGATWRRQAQDAPNFADDFRGVAFPDTQHGWAVGGASPEGGGLIIATSNGGKTWERQTIPVTNDDMGITDLLWGIAFADINHGLAVGDNGTILATANGGRTWTSKPSGTDARLFRVAFTDINRGWAVGQATGGGGVILVTDDGGDTWIPQIPEPSPVQALLGLAFPDSCHGWLVGVSGTILRSLEVTLGESMQHRGTPTPLFPLGPSRRSQLV